MNEAKKIIAKMVENGDYFNDAKQWYVSKYLYPYTQRIYLLILSISIIIFCVLAVKVALIDQEKKKYPFPIYFDNQVKYYSKIMPISYGTEPIPISVARYLAASYVEARESYDFKIINNKEEWKQLLRKIRSLSSRKVFSNYIDFMDTSRNPDSPVIKYKNNTKRIVEIEDVDFPRISNNPESAKVYYKVTEKSDEEEKESHWIANMSFSMTDINNVLDYKVSMQFTITKYDTYEDKDY